MEKMRFINVILMKIKKVLRDYFLLIAMYFPSFLIIFLNLLSLVLNNDILLDISFLEMYATIDNF